MRRLYLSLRTWLVLSHLVVFTLPVLALVGTGALANDLRTQTREDLEHQAALLAQHIEYRLAASREPLSGLGLDDTLIHAKEATLAGFRVTDTSGRIVASSGSDHGEDISRDPEVATALAGSPGMAIKERARIPSSRESLKGPSRHASVRVFVARPVREDGDVVGAVVLSRTPREEVQAFYQMAPRLSVGALLALAGTVGLAFGAGRILSRSLRSLAEASHGIAAGSEAALVALEPASRSRVAEARALAAAMGTMSARLRQRLRYISEFAGNVSHEFKTPVSSLRGTIELLRDDDDMPPEQRARFLENALADLDRLSRLVGGLLRLARAEEGGARSVFSLDDVLGELVARHPTVTRAGMAARVDANREQIESALTNLVENALRHGGPDVHVRVEGFTDGAHTGVDVVDDGPGISPANLSKVFDRFFTTDRAKGGTGLGLALVRAVAEAHGGRVDVESAPGRTRFRLVLPRIQGAR
ncbi:MAG: ATP-binding protein [Pseudomonadota bacterium]|nr:ATP-binding protein [Pseudomonadota bacterium]